MRVAGGGLLLEKLPPSSRPIAAIAIVLPNLKTLFFDGMGLRLYDRNRIDGLYFLEIEQGDFP
jgi:hypothetical protein